MKKTKKYTKKTFFDNCLNRKKRYDCGMDKEDTKKILQDGKGEKVDERIYSGTERCSKNIWWSDSFRRCTVSVKNGEKYMHSWEKMAQESQLLLK